jgi:hypothetical protein
VKPTASGFYADAPGSGSGSGSIGAAPRRHHVGRADPYDPHRRSERALILIQSYPKDDPNSRDPEIAPKENPFGKKYFHAFRACAIDFNSPGDG